MADLSKQQVRDIIAKAPEGTNPAGIIAELRNQGHKLEGYEEAPYQAHRVSAHARLRPQKSSGVGATVGGMVGGMAGTPGGYAGRVGGATLGGTAGEAIEQGGPQLFGPTPGLAMAQMDPRAIGQAGLTQGASEATGALLGKVPGLVLGPASRQVNRFLAARTENVVRAADKAGVHIDATKAMDQAIAPFMKRAQAAGVDAVKKLEIFRENFLGNKAWFGPNPQGTLNQAMPAGAAHEAKEYFDAIAKQIYKAKDSGGAVPGDVLVAATAKRLADNLRAQLGSQVSGYRKALMEEAKTIGKRRLLEGAARPAAYVGAAAAMHETPGVNKLPWYVKYGVIPGVAAAAARPNMVSAAADIATNPAVQLWLQGAMANLMRAGALGAQGAEEDTTAVPQQ